MDLEGVTSSTLLLSQDVAAEVLQILKPDAAVVCYDFFLNTPKNSSAEGVKSGRALLFVSWVQGEAKEN